MLDKIRNNRHIALQIVSVAVVLAALYWPILYDLFMDWWTRPELSYGLLIPPLSAGIAWGRRDIIFAAPALPDNRGIVLAATGCVMYLVG